MIRLQAGVLFVAMVIVGCTAPSEEGPECTQPGPAAPLEAVESGTPVALSCVRFGAIGLPENNPDYRHMLMLDLVEGVHLSLYFHNSLAAPATVDMATCALDNFETCGAYINDYLGFEGGPRYLCGQGGGFPPNAATAGAVTLDKLVVGKDGLLVEAHGSLEVTLENCDLPYAGSSGDLTLRGAF